MIIVISICILSVFRNYNLNDPDTNVLTLMSAVLGFVISMYIAMIFILHYTSPLDTVNLANFDFSIIWTSPMKRKIKWIDIYHISHEKSNEILYSPDKKRYREEYIYPYLQDHLERKIDPTILKNSGGIEHLIGNLQWSCDRNFRRYGPSPER